jgi:hypothetical protein
MIPVLRRRSVEPRKRSRPEVAAQAIDELGEAVGRAVGRALGPKVGDELIPAQPAGTRGSKQGKQGEGFPLGAGPAPGLLPTVHR